MDIPTKEKGTPPCNESVLAPHKTPNSSTWSPSISESQVSIPKKHKETKASVEGMKERSIFSLPTPHGLIRPASQKPTTKYYQRKNALDEPEDRPTSFYTKFPTPYMLATGTHVYNAAIENTLNDSELVRGVGYVPVNRYYPPSTPAKPWSLPEHARQDLEVKVAHFITSEKPLDPKKERTLMWRGKNDFKILVSAVDNSDSVIFDIQNLQTIKYAMGEKVHHLSLTYDPWGDKKTSDTMVLEIHATEHEFAVLKFCCYKANIMASKECTSASFAFFEEKRRELMLIHNPIPRMPLPPPPPPRIGPLLPEKPKRSPRAPRPKRKSAPPPRTKDHQSIFYDTNDLSRPLIRANSGDCVMRIHKKDGEFAEYDGPWTIQHFRRNGYSVLIKLSEKPNAEVTRADYDERSWQQMLKIEAQLNFPEHSAAFGKWVCIGELLPCIDLSNMAPGEVISGGVAVDAMENFKELKMRMTGQQVEDDELFFPETAAQFEEDLHCFEIGDSKFLATVREQTNGRRYKVQKLIEKRLRRFEKDDGKVKAKNLVTDDDDPWVQRLKKKFPQLLQNQVVVAEFRVQGAGRPLEDKKWAIGQSSIKNKSFIQYFNDNTDPFRNLPLDAEVDKAQLVYQGDLKPRYQDTLTSQQKSRLKTVSNPRQASSKHPRTAFDIDANEKPVSKRRKGSDGE